MSNSTAKIANGQPSPNGHKKDELDILEEWTFVCPTNELANALGTSIPAGLNTCVWPSDRKLKPDIEGKNVIIVSASDKASLTRASTIKRQLKKAKAAEIREWVLHGLGVEFETLSAWRQAFDLGKQLAVERPWVKARELLQYPAEEEQQADPPADSKERSPSFAPYVEKDNCLLSGAKLLANFTARIRKKIARHEGGSEGVRFQIWARHQAGHEREIDVELKEFSSMGWTLELGPEFAISPTRESRDLLRHAIQILSFQDGITHSVQHTSLGWVQQKGKWLYLHAAGAIGASGPSEAVGVDVHSSLGRYRLPSAIPEPATLLKAMEAHCLIWGLGNDRSQGGRGAAAVLATLPWRAVLDPFDASIHFGGPSGNFKTSVARLAYQHFADVKGTNSPMPADWRSTVNALQRLAFDCRHSLLVIDDLKLDEDIKKAEILMQSQGNLQSRLRMNADQRMHQSLDPRGSILSTGEIDPRTSSTLGRVFMAEIRRGDIDRGTLFTLQEAGDKGFFSTMMAAYVRWLAPKLEEIRAGHVANTAKLRLEIGDIDGSHSRHPDIVAELLAAYGVFMAFAIESKLLSRLAADSYLIRAKELLTELAKAQVELQEDARPGRRFLDLIVSALQSKRCHLLDAESEEAPSLYPADCGWRSETERGSTFTIWKVPNGSRCIGYIDQSKGIIYLDPTESEAIANNMGKERNNLQSFANIGRELLSENLVMPGLEQGRNPRATQSIRVKPGASTMRRYCIRINTLFGLDTVTH